MEYKDYYRILGVSKNATEQEIKKAYRDLARKYHPDAHAHSDPAARKAAEERFKEINEAYEVLSDPDKRRKYDQFGAQWQQFTSRGGNPQDFWQQWYANQGGGPTGGVYTRTVSPEEFEQIFGESGFSDFFEMLFGRGGFGFGPFAERAGGVRVPRRGQDAEQPITVTLQEAYHGARRVLQLNGERIEVTIPRGVKTGSKVRVAGKGAPGVAGGAAGDLYLRVEVLPDPTFTREGDDLRVRVPVDLYTMILGGEVQVPTLDRPVVLTVPPETPNGKVFRLRGLGMPNLRHPDQRGDLYAVVEVQLPKDLSERERELFRELRRLRSR
jgi:curved DNA-binding protein